MNEILVQTWLSERLSPSLREELQEKKQMKGNRKDGRCAVEDDQ